MEFKISESVKRKIEDDITESYINPISLVMEEMSEMISKEIDNNMMVSINQTMGFNVDKYELIKALKYDREQYDKGYMDASRRYANLLEENVKLEKALDKACEMLEKCNYQINTQIGYDDWETKKDWKEWCFKDV